VCYEPIYANARGTGMTGRDCAHPPDQGICASCWMGQLHRLIDGDRSTALACMVPGCGGVMNYRTLQLFLNGQGAEGKALLGRWNELNSQTAREQVFGNTYVACANGCGDGQNIQNGALTMTCVRCHEVTCVTHRQARSSARDRGDCCIGAYLERLEEQQAA
jgi:hypothetical protein